MRVLPILVLVLAGAGCLSGGSADVQDFSVDDAGVFIADGDGLRPAGEVLWLTVEEGDQPVYTLDWLALADPDVLPVVLVQALEDQSVDSDFHSDIDYAPDRLAGGEAHQADDFCTFELVEAFVPGEAYLDLAQGREATLPESNSSDRQYFWQMYPGASSPLVASYGITLRNGMLALMDAGDWLVFAGGVSGIPASDLHADGNTWTLRIEAEGSVRIIVLAPTELLCGVGFERFRGTQAGGVTQGGGLAGNGRYGVTGSFRGDGELVADTGLALGSNQATLTFGDEQVQLTDMSNVWRNGYALRPNAIDNERWFGYPQWMLAGFNIPHRAELGLDGGGLSGMNAPSDRIVFT